MVGLSIISITIRSVLLNEDAVVMWGDSPVLTVVVLVSIILLVVGEEPVKLNALLEVLDSFHASDVLEEIEVSMNVDASSDKSVPVNTLELQVRVILVELEVQSLTEVNVWSLDRVHILTGHLKLIEIEIFWKHLHIINLILNYKF